MFLLDELDSRIIFLSTKLLSHLLIVQGPQYTKRFGEKHGGFTVLRQKLKPWWNTPAIWTICFSLMFGIDPSTINFDEDFNHFALADIFSRRPVHVIYPEVFPVLTGMLEHGLRAIVQDGYTASSTNDDENGYLMKPNTGNDSRPTITRERSMSLNVDRYSRGKSNP
jgi:hypothetical protein